MRQPGDVMDSAGGSFAYRVEGACCRLYDREELPWPCCRLSWKGKEPSWRRVGPRFVGDISVRRFASYAVTGSDRHGARWRSVVTDFSAPLSAEMRRWWYAKTPPPGMPWPELPAQ